MPSSLSGMILVSDYWRSKKRNQHFKVTPRYVVILLTVGLENGGVLLEKREFSLCSLWNI